MEPVFRTLEIASELAVAAVGTRISYQGLDNIPRRGGAVLAINHTSYVDFMPAGLATRRRRRRIRYLAKAEMRDVAVVDFLIRHTGVIAVNRQAGAGAYAEAVRALHAGEIVGVYPEATISRSFELKEFKSGTARMATEAGVPVIPMIIWGAQRIWTKDHRRQLGRNKIPITVRVGPPLAPSGDVAGLEVRIRTVMTDMLHAVQQEYPHPPGAWWVPRRLEGGAPTPAEAEQLDRDELARRARRAG
jgi:1-acyl-sn-glycerol-3-phosphate acyltransferase